MESLNLRSALERNGATLDESQIKFVSAIENEMNEIRYIQTAYLKALADETNMTYQQLRRMINRKVNVYLSAEEAVKLGIADIVI